MNSIRQCVKEASNIRLERNKATAEVIETESALKRWDRTQRQKFQSRIPTDDRSIDQASSHTFQPTLTSNTI
jgi:hypothetical protein